MNKRRSKETRFRGHSPRRVGTREVRQRFLIVCEGEQTEPAYFRAFQVPGLVVDIRGVAESALRLVEEAQYLCNEDSYDQVWCVFDCDDLQPDHIHRAIELAERNHFGIAFSNRAFELWYLLHFHYYNTALSRHDYCEALSRLLGCEYTKNRRNIYDVLLPRQEEAINNARRLIQQYNPRRPAYDDPSTTVHELVEELNKYRRP